MVQHERVMSVCWCLQVEFVEQLPKTVSGKIRRIELRKKEWEEKELEEDSDEEWEHKYP